MTTIDELHHAMYQARLAMQDATHAYHTAIDQWVQAACPPGYVSTRRAQAQPNTEAAAQTTPPPTTTPSTAPATTSTAPPAGATPAARSSTTIPSAAAE